MRGRGGGQEPYDRRGRRGDRHRRAWGGERGRMSRRLPGEDGSVHHDGEEITRRAGREHEGGRTAAGKFRGDIRCALARAGARSRRTKVGGKGNVDGQMR